MKEGRKFGVTIDFYGLLNINIVGKKEANNFKTSFWIVVTIVKCKKEWCNEFIIPLLFMSQQLANVKQHNNNHTTI